MINFLTVLFMVVGIIGLIGFFAYAVCWLAHQEETMKGEDDYPDERPVLKVTVLKQEVDDDEKGDNKNKR